MMRLSILIAAMLLPTLVMSQEVSVEAPDPVTTEAVEPKTFDQMVLVRTSLVHPGLLEEGASGWGTIAARFGRGRFLGIANGYELAPDAPAATVQFDITEQGTRSSVFRTAFKAYRNALRLLAIEDHYANRIAEALEANPEADVSAWQAKLSAVRVQLNISE
jgi:hypothetical protein